MLAYIKYYITLIKNKICAEIEDLQTELKIEETKNEVMEKEIENVEEALLALEQPQNTNEQDRGERHEAWKHLEVRKDIGSGASHAFAANEFRDLIANLTGDIKELLKGMRTTKQFKSEDTAVEDGIRLLGSSAADTTVEEGIASSRPGIRSLKKNVEGGHADNVDRVAMYRL